ncbi:MULTISPECIES: hypothetical protein [Sphingobium]|uniref:hypothetical protein n=1 Tax=Sphingobium TaxID=165695 RepID=UPI001BE9ED0A|nr:MULTISPECIES: hypothetical protein [Sphingobium]MBT2246350.1 hypothetical protein [Sphingobium sp. BHU LFT2]WBQ19247.1 hypothetical protein PAE53_22895 [Sphingobium yanoikuyae]
MIPLIKSPDVLRSFEVDVQLFSDPEELQLLDEPSLSRTLSGHLIAFGGAALISAVFIMRSLR